jgi:hypothetical protein
MDSSQSPSPNDQRRIWTTEPAIGVDVAELGASLPDATPQPAPVNPTTLVPSAKTFEFLRQLETLAHEVAVVGRGNSSDRCINAQKGSNFSPGLETVEPSIRVSPHDQLASDTPPFARRTFLTLTNLFTATREWLASYRPLLGGRTSATLANFSLATREWLASYRPLFGGRTSATLASFFVAALIGIAATFIWQSQRVTAAKLPNDVAAAEKQSGATPVGQLSLQATPPQIVPTTQTAPASTAPAPSTELVQQLEGMARDLVVLRRRVEELAAEQERLAGAQEQLTARQEQMAQNIAKPQAVQRNINHKMSPPPRRNASPETTAQAVPRPRPPLSVPPDR